MAKKSKRQQAILRRNLFLGCVSVVLIAAIVLLVWVISEGMGGNGGENSSPDTTPSQTESTDDILSQNTNKNETKKPLDTTPQSVQLGDFEGNANYNRTVLVNFKNLLSKEQIDNNTNLMVFPLEYKKGSTGEIYRKLDKDMWPYLKAMMDAARADGIDIGIISAWRSYDTQRILFDDKVNRLKSQGYSQEAAEKEAATCIALPGTSEHHTGLAVDFNSTNQSFENTKTFAWLKKNAENYGFIMRYPSDKMDITGGIIYEPWHWRYVGINISKEMNELGMCYEEYCEYKGFEGYNY